MKNTLAGGLVDGLNRSPVSAIGLLTIAFPVTAASNFFRVVFRADLSALLRSLLTLAIRTLFFADLMFGHNYTTPIA